MSDSNYDLSSTHPFRLWVAESVRASLRDRVRLEHSELVEGYVTDLLVRFMRADRHYAIRDDEGRPITSVAAMTERGDIRFGARNFDEEREVHRHIGDFLLYWGGMFPEHLDRMRRQNGLDLYVDPIRQGKMSYHIASTFTHEPFGREAPVMGRLRDDFEAVRYGLHFVRRRLALA